MHPQLGAERVRGEGPLVQLERLLEVAPADELADHLAGQREVGPGVVLGPGERGLEVPVVGLGCPELRGRPSRSRSRPPRAASGPARATGPAPRRRPPPPRPRRRPPAADGGRRTRSGRPVRGSGAGAPFLPLPAPVLGGMFATSSRARIASAAACSSRSCSTFQSSGLSWCFSASCSRSCARSESTRRWASLTRSAGPAAAGFLPNRRYRAPPMSPMREDDDAGDPVALGHRRISARTASRYGSSDVGRSTVGSGAAPGGRGRRMVRAMANPPPTSSARGQHPDQDIHPARGRVEQRPLAVARGEEVADLLIASSRPRPARGPCPSGRARRRSCESAMERPWHIGQRSCLPSAWTRASRGGSSSALPACCGAYVASTRPRTSAVIGPPPRPGRAASARRACPSACWGSTGPPPCPG